MTKDRTGKFWWEYNTPHHITLESMRGLYDPALTSDCRCGRECWNCEFGNYCELRPWMALCSIESWGEKILTPDGLPDGDMPHSDNGQMVPFEDIIACDIFGRPYYLYDDLEENEFEDIEPVQFFQETQDDKLNGLLHPDQFVLTDVEEQDFEPETDMPMDKIPIVVLPFGKRDVYDHLPDDLPTRTPNSHSIVSRRKWDSDKDIRMASKNGSNSHGWRGNNRYKKKRRRTEREMWSHLL